MPGQAAKVFWSWQNDYSPKTCRHFIREALVAAIAQVADEIGVDDADRPEIDHDTKGERGMADIATTILNKIADAAVFAADLTPVAQSPAGKWLPNPNVMIELGWAMHRPGWERVIGVLNTASGAKVEDLPFDIRQRRILTFVLAENADRPTRLAVRSKLVSELAGALRVNLQERAEEVAATTTITCVAASSDNYSIWGSAGETLIHNDAFGGARRGKVAIPDTPRSYMRVIPAGWKNEIPSVSDIARLHQSQSVDAPSDSARDGDFGATEEGFVRYWITEWSEAKEPSSSNMTMFFEDTGEFWMLHGSVVVKHQGQPLLRDHLMLGQWSRTLRKAMKVIDRLQGHRTRRVEAGLFGVKDLHWFSEWQGDRTPSRRNATREVLQSADWSAEAQLTFLTNAYNRVRNLFALERSTEAEVTQILQQFDPERFQTKASE
ncbi:hypothetical protein P3C58_18980 [Mesorhizobium sp. XAP10]|uniref:hypothetical protein n=1 Tax=unclassified Mesorhizobium TaxID=325217 RepID=UPI0023E00652|nr:MULTISPECIES: hypothetical protein [unclassified Mesorhizobium]MDF3154066.1 hypothetical protein [Mesorhizobium sp. XAP10]MDF3247165.1 hypothetical protein [Mesorhizobium sp. XAP4]